MDNRNVSPPDKNDAKSPAAVPEGKDNDDIKNLIEQNAKKERLVSPSKKAAAKLRSRFQQALSKLSSNDTNQVAMQELQQLIRENLVPDALKTFVMALGDATTITSRNGKESMVCLLGYLACSFKQNLLDPRDKSDQGSPLVKTVARMLELIRRYFKVFPRGLHSGRMMRSMSTMHVR